jgi:hypothetical protein
VQGERRQAAAASPRPVNQGWTLTLTAHRSQPAVGEVDGSRALGEPSAQPLEVFRATPVQFRLPLPRGPIPFKKAVKDRLNELRRKQATRYSVAIPNARSSFRPLYTPGSRAGTPSEA